MSADDLTIVVTGGGSGGHITPLLAVAHELKSQRPGCRIVAIGQRGDSLGDVIAKDSNIDAVHTVRAGKLRRYHGEGLRQLLDLPTVGRNLRDAFYVLAGIVQSYRLLRRLRPQVVFVKGGFVGVPVGLAAAWLRIPYVTHDSDALPGLANRIIARWAAKHAVALPKEIYRYPAGKTVTVGVPIARQYQPVDDAARQAARGRIGLPATGRAVLVTGGGLGAQRLNEAVVSIAPGLLRRYPDLTLLHLAGRLHEQSIGSAYDSALAGQDRGRVQVVGFTDALYDYSAAADVVVCRAGGTNLAEFAAQHKTCIVVPNPELTGGHQLKNAQALAERQAVRVLDDRAVTDNPQLLLEGLSELFDQPETAGTLGRNLGQLAQTDAAQRLAALLLVEAGVS